MRILACPSVRGNNPSRSGSPYLALVIFPGRNPGFPPPSPCLRRYEARPPPRSGSGIAAAPCAACCGRALAPGPRRFPPNGHPWFRQHRPAAAWVSCFSWAPPGFGLAASISFLWLLGRRFSRLLFVFPWRVMVIPLFAADAQLLAPQPRGNFLHLAFRQLPQLERAIGDANQSRHF